jgi:hypothetical protein
MVSSKRFTEAKIFEDELKQVSALNEALVARNQEFETQLAEDRQEKDGKHKILFNYNHVRVIL